MTTKPCTCGGTMELCPAHWDEADADGNRAVLLKAAWVCDTCWKQEPVETEEPGVDKESVE